MITILDNGNGDYFTDGNAVASTSALGAVTSLGEDAEIDDLEASDVNYYRVQVVLWLEGEDESCTSETFLDLKGDWAVELQFSYSTAVSQMTIDNAVAP